MAYKVGIAGKGFVGTAVYEGLSKRGCSVVAYDKFKNIGKPEDLLNADMIFLCLPTPFIDSHGFDISAIIEICAFLSQSHYKGPVILKSTVEPGTTRKLYEKFGLKFCHNPEFLTARTAIEDFDNQKHIVLGVHEMGSKDDILVYSMYRKLWYDAKISRCSWEESESMKLLINNFYAAKVQIFNEFYFLCQKIGIDYDKVRDLMIGNNLILKSHTFVPGPDGKLSFGGMCFIKDTLALEHFMENNDIPHEVISAIVKERITMRND